MIGGAGMVKEFFNILDDHKEKTKAYYESLTQQELDSALRLAGCSTVKEVHTAILETGGAISVIPIKK